MANQNEKPFIRPDKLWEAFGLGGGESLDDDTRAMQRLLVEEYKKRGIALLDEIKKHREANPDTSLADAIKFLFNNLETK